MSDDVARDEKRRRDAESDGLRGDPECAPRGIRSAATTRDGLATPSNVGVIEGDDNDDDDVFLAWLAEQDRDYEKFVKDLWAPSALAKRKNSSS